MNRIKIKAPANSLKGTKLQIEAGAKELYCGFQYNNMNNATFSGRAQKSCYSNIKTVMPYDEYRKAVKYAHDNGVKVELTANVPITTDCKVENENNIRESYLEYVKMGIDAGVDRVIVGDLGNLLYLKEAGIDVPITASTFFSALNIDSIRMMEDIGISKIVLPHHLTISEIKKITESTNIKVEVFGHFGCAFLEGTCSLIHLNNDHISTGITCRGKYRINSSDQIINILDTNEDCSLCQLDVLMDTGIDSIKTIGRDLDPAFMASLTAAYSLAIELFLEGHTKNEVLEEIKESMDFSFWNEIFCSKNRCKYVNEAYLI